MALDSSHRAGQTVLPGCQDVRSCCLATGHGPKLNVWEIRAESKSGRSPTPSDRLQAPATQTPLLYYGVSPHGQSRTPWLEKEYVRAPTVFWGTLVHPHAHGHRTPETQVRLRHRCSSNWPRISFTVEARTKRNPRQSNKDDGD